MTIYDLIKEHYSEYLFKLKKIYPELLEFSKKVPAVSWKDEYSIADRNPEIITELEKLENLFNEGKISEEEYRKRASELSHAYSSIRRAFLYERGYCIFQRRKTFHLRHSSRTWTRLLQSN